MINRFSLTFLFTCIFSALTYAGGGATAYDAIHTAQKNVRPDLVNHVIEVRGSNGNPNPRKWEVVFFDPKISGKKLVIEVNNNQMTKERRPSDLLKDLSVNNVIEVNRLKVDSDGAFKIAQKVAQEENKLMIARAHYVLRKLEPKKGSSAAWFIKVYDSQGHDLGELVISAYTGKILRTKKLYHDGERAKNFGEKVEETFLGIGGELEETFTGKRTVDKPATK
ncbi:MAG: hypothetical protein SGI71_03415 [Verrucomicrobiota bacterium]|nr:hypothetical protein [Verrucomicrobiota bacterium]